MPPGLPTDLPTRTPWPEAKAMLDSLALPQIPDRTVRAEERARRGRRRPLAHGALRLRRRVELNLLSGCTLAFCADPVLSAANGDGCDPESCTSVVVRRCTLASGDNNLALKSGRDQDGLRVGVPCSGVVVLACQAEGRFGFITCGSELSAGVSDVWVSDCWTYGQGVGSLLWVKSNSRRGGYVRNVNLSGLRGRGLRSSAVAVNARYGDQVGDHPPELGGILLQGSQVDGATFLFDLDGLPEAPLGPVTARDAALTGLCDGLVPSRFAPQVTLAQVTVDGRRVGG